MTTDNCINLTMAIIVGGGTLTLAFMTWRSIRQTRKIHETERKDRLLNEIIEWAIDVCRCGLKPSPIPASKISTKSNLYLLDTLSTLLLEYESISGRSEYIRRIALIFGNNLQNEINSLSDVTTGRIKLIEKQMDILNGKRSDSSDMAEIAETAAVKEWISSQDWPEDLNNNFKVNMFVLLMNRTILLDNAKQVIEEATKIKTKDIS